jgi:poly(3-hydroxybutyrate) depolymerase
MKLVAVLLVVLFLVTCPGHASQKSEGKDPGKIVKQSISSQGRNRTFYLFVPENISTAKPAPLIVLLHGSGRNGLSLVEKWKDIAAKEGIILAGPDSTNSNTWSSKDDGPDFLRDLVENFKSKYPINSRRIYLFGHSAGAVYSLTLSMIESEYFAATAVHAGAWRDQGEFDVIDAATRKIPLAIWVGTNDPYFPLQAVRNTRAALQAKGFPIEVTEMPGHDHWYYDLAPKINQSAWEFLKQHELPTEQRYVEIGSEADNARANALLQEMNNLRTEAFNLSQQAEAIDKELVRKDISTQLADARLLAQRELDLLKKSSGLWSEAADKADSAAKLRLNAKNSRYVALVGRHNRKNAEIIQAMFPQVEVYASNDSLEPIRAKRNEVISRVTKLQVEAAELQKQIEILMK